MKKYILNLLENERNYLVGEIERQDVMDRHAINNGHNHLLAVHDERRKRHGKEVAALETTMKLVEESDLFK